MRVRQYYVAHPTLAPIINAIGGFDVFGSPWFAAVYLLLFISLAGCVIPRSRRHIRAMRARPPAAPRNLGRLPYFTSWTTEVPAGEVVTASYGLLRSKRFRADAASTSVAAEKGHLRETGNLVFHLSLLVVLVGIAVSSNFGFTGTVLVTEHTGFSDTAIAYDELKLGDLVSRTSLPPFSFTLNSFDATYERTGATRGAANSFDAHITWQPNPNAPVRTDDITVNHPLSTGGANVYLVGHGYAPHFRVTDGSGQVFDQVTPFLPQGSTFESQGVVKLPDAVPQQLGITGFFLPSAVDDPSGRPVSVFPAPDNPVVVIGVFAGNLGLDSGVPQSVYTLDTTKHEAPGDHPNGAGPDADAAERAGQRDVRRLRPVGDLPDQPRPWQGRGLGVRRFHGRRLAAVIAGAPPPVLGAGGASRSRTCWAYLGRGRWPDQN